MTTTRRIELCEGFVNVFRNNVLTKKIGPFATLTDLYRALNPNYPKFYKMDPLCKTAFIAAELALEGLCPEEKSENLDIIIFTHSGCIASDKAFEDSIREPDNSFPSPAIFVYTLPNIMAGEIAIRHKVYGETSVYCGEYSDLLIDQHLSANPTRWLLAGQLEALSDRFDSTQNSPRAIFSLHQPSEIQ